MMDGIFKAEIRWFIQLDGDEEVDLQTGLDQIGRKGWELVAVHEDVIYNAGHSKALRYIFKRPQ